MHTQREFKSYIAREERASLFCCAWGLRVKAVRGLESGHTRAHLSSLSADGEGDPGAKNPPAGTGESQWTLQGLL